MKRIALSIAVGLWVPLVYFYEKWDYDKFGLVVTLWVVLTMYILQEILP